MKDAVEQETHSEDDLYFIQNSQCGFIDDQVVVCCENLGDLIPKPGVCGFNFADRIYDGDESQIGEFPWSALLEYTNGNLNVPDTTRD